MQMICKTSKKNFNNLIKIARINIVIVLNNYVQFHFKVVLPSILIAGFKLKTVIQTFLYVNCLNFNLPIQINARMIRIKL